LWGQVGLVHPTPSSDAPAHACRLLRALCGLLLAAVLLLLMAGWRFILARGGQQQQQQQQQAT
jgi:hypothetical protein